jgi:hypothetical protein
MTLTKKQPGPKKEYQKIGFDLKVSIIYHLTNGHICLIMWPNCMGISHSFITYWIKKLHHPN